MGWGRVVVAACGLAVCASGLRAQQPGGSPAGSGAGQAGADTVDTSGPIATIRTTARLVVLDVVVNDKHGRPVKGLEAEDFTLLEDGVPQRVASFVEHDAASDAVQPDAEDELPPNTFAVQPPVMGHGAMTVIVLGQLGFEDAPFVRDQLKAYLMTAAPETPVAIFRMDRDGMHLVQGFTADPKVLQEAAASRRILPPLGFAPTGRPVVRGTLQLSHYLSSIPGRINVIWFSSSGGGAPEVGGIRPDDAFSDVSTFVRDLNGSRNVLRLSRVALYAVNASGISALSNLVPTDAPMWFVPDIPEARLAEMAEKAGGKAFYNTNGFKEAIAQVVASGAHYYTISYTPTNPNWDNRYRAIHVDVDTHIVPSRLARFFAPVTNLYDWLNDTVTVEYRRGYFARKAGPEPPAMQTAGYSAPATGSSPELPQRRLISVSPKGDPNPIQDPMRKAMEFASPTPFDMPFKITVTPMPEVERLKGNAPLPKDNFMVADWRSTPFRNYRVHFSLSPEDLQFIVSADGTYHYLFRCVVVIFRDDGEAVNSISTMVPVDLKAEEYERVMQAGMGFDQTIAIPTRGNSTAVAITGNFFMRAAIEEVATGRIGAIEVPAEWVKALPPGGAAQATR